MSIKLSFGSLAHGFAGLVLCALILCSCSISGAVVPPLQDEPAQVQAQVSSGGHNLWGFWEGYIPESFDRIDFTPLRTADFHLNARRLMEETVCQNCITVLSVIPNPAEQKLSAEIRLTHPYPGLDNLTGFDVRAVVITDGSKYYPSLNAVVPLESYSDFTLINPDGYTRLWNMLEFPPGSGPAKILEYSQGKFASPGTFTGTVNPYIEYSQEPRNHFPAGASITKTHEFRIGGAPIKFGYAVDASWEPALVIPVGDIMTDFPPEANALEPYILSSFQPDILTSEQYATGTLVVYLADRQSALEHVDSLKLFECPELQMPYFEAGAISIVEQDYLWNVFRIEFALTNVNGAEAGTYPGLLCVMDIGQDEFLGDINHSYQVVEITVSEPSQGP
ncbi:MAG TPA: hypothetical protein ENN67_06925, partial [Firmicutes bacterium]|nr:hypothetical protein [Bacillota bacterium]